MSIAKSSEPQYIQMLERTSSTRGAGWSTVQRGSRRARAVADINTKAASPEERAVDTYSPSLEDLSVDLVRQDAAVGEDPRERGRGESDESGEREHLLC